MKTIRRFIAALAAAASLGASAGQYSDLWWNPQESGWGVNVVQQLETAFVTLFVYAPDGSPTWYVAPEAHVIAYGTGGMPLFEGALYSTRGPWHGGPFDPASVEVYPVGRVSLEVLAKDRMRVHYTTGGVSQVKEVVRQTWQPALLAANYTGQFVLRQAPVSGPPYGTREYQADVLAHFAEEGFMRVDDALGRRCEYRGPWAQKGKLLTFSGSYACTSGDSPAGTFEIADVEVSEHGVTGYLRTFSATLKEFGRFAAVRR